MHVQKGDKVIRETNCKHVSHLYGEVLFWGNSKSGRLMVVCETPEGAFFVSDPSNLKKVIIDDKVQPPRTREGYRASG